LKALCVLKPLRPAVFFDRDGTLNVEKNYLHRIEDWEWIDGAVAALARLQAAGFALVVITNQAGIARGLYDEAAVHTLHSWMREQLKTHGVTIDGIYFCPHHPDFTPNYAQVCQCRKPNPGMVLQAAREHGLDLGNSWVVGDRWSDLQAGEAAGLAGGVLVRTGYGAVEEQNAPALRMAWNAADSITQACERILAAKQ
jgi:D-glycero-D-manno-heptose 1,7-bisphosphate phosphatase